MCTGAAAWLVHDLKTGQTNVGVDLIWWTTHVRCPSPPTGRGWAAIERVLAVDGTVDVLNQVGLGGEIKVLGEGVGQDPVGVRLAVVPEIDGVVAASTPSTGREG